MNKGLFLYSNADHFFSQYFTQITPGTPLVIFFFILLFFIIIPPKVQLNMRNCLFPNLKEPRELDTEETIFDDVGSYWSVLKPLVKDIWIKEEAVTTERLGMPCLMQKSFQELFMAKMSEGLASRRTKTGTITKPDRLQGVHNYDILANPEYAEKFHYIPCVFPNRD